MSYEMYFLIKDTTQTSAVTILGTKNVLQTPVNDVISLVDNKEMARNALQSYTLSVVSSFKR